MNLFDCIVCDDIRREIENKHTLVGVYDDLNIHLPPNVAPDAKIPLRLSFFLRFRVKLGEEVPNSFAVDLLCGAEKLIQPIEGLIPAEKIVSYFQLALIHVSFFLPSKARQIELEINLRKDQKILKTVKPDPLQVRFI